MAEQKTEPAMSGGPNQTPIRDLAEGARKHYERVSTYACDWSSIIPAAIDAWEREKLAAEQAGGASGLSAEPQRNQELAEALDDVAQCIENGDYSAPKLDAFVLRGAAAALRISIIVAVLRAQEPPRELVAKMPDALLVAFMDWIEGQEYFEAHRMGTDVPYWTVQPANGGIFNAPTFREAVRAAIGDGTTAAALRREEASK